MKPAARFLFVVAGLTMAVPGVPSAHFKLVEPASWLRRKRPRRSAEGRPLRRLQYRLGQAELHRRQGRRRPEAASQGSGDHLPPRALSRGARGQLADRAAGRSASHDEGQRQGAAVRVGGDPEPGADSGARRRPVRAHRAPPGRRRRSRRTCSCRTSTARSARCKSCSSWPSTGSTTPADTPITTAPICRSRRTRPSRSTPGWPAERRAAVMDASITGHRRNDQDRVAGRFGRANRSLERQATWHTPSPSSSTSVR